MSRPAPWRIADVLDFEHLLTTESESGSERAHELYVQHIAPRLSSSAATDRATVFRQWLELRRASLGAASPGRYFDTGWQTLLTVALLGGLVLGGGVTAGVLHYHENEPVNAIEFLQWTLLPQWLFLLGVLLLVTLRTTLGLGNRFEPLRSMLRGLMEGFAALLRRLPGDERAAVGRTFARVREHRDRYGALATWPVVIATQLFAVCFNVGILGTLITEVTVRELRFGWQTTLEVSPGDVSRLVRAFAVPWSWAPHAHPTPEQIAATRYAPGQRHETLPAEAMRSWWPFLVYAVGFYGLAVRASLLLYAAGKLRGSLNGLSFHYPEANALWHRMLGPVITAEETANPASPPRSAMAEPAGAHAPGGSCWVLVAHELELNEAAVAGYLEKTYGWQPARFLRIKIDNRRANAAELAELRAAAAGLRAVVILAPAQRDPIVAIALFLKDVLTAMNKDSETLLLLVGEEPELSRLQFWRDFKAEHQLGIGIEPWLTA